MAKRRSKDVGTAGAPGAPAAALRDGALHRTLTYRLHLVHKLTDQESQRRYQDETHLSMSEGRCLATVGSFEPLSVNDVARASNLNKGQASRAAQALVTRKLVEKTADPNDGRGVVLRLTPEGRRRWEQIMALIHKRNEEIFSCITPDERRVLSDLLDRLAAHAVQGSHCSAVQRSDSRNDASADTAEK